MTQVEHISNRFSDQYLVALMASGDTDTVLRTFSTDHPEMSERFASDMRDLELMYGYMREAEKPTEKEIASAYKNISARIGGEPLVERTKVRSNGLKSVPLQIFATIRQMFIAKPVFAFAYSGIGVAVIIALLWQPLGMQLPIGTVAQNNPQGQVTNGTGDYAVNNTPTIDNTNPSQIQPPTFRGPKSGYIAPTKEKLRQDSLDAIRMKTLAGKYVLWAPTNLKLEPLTFGSVLVYWSASPNAFGYIVEMKRANEDKFAAVSQTTQTRFLMHDLRSGETIFIRIVPTSGEHKGTASDAKSIIVP